MPTKTIQKPATLLSADLPADVRFWKIEENKFVLDVPDGVEVKEPVMIKLAEADISFTCELKIQVGANARVTVVQDFERTSKTPEIHYRLDVEAAPDSYARVVTFQNLSSDTVLNAIQETQVAKGANVHLVDLQFGGKSVSTQLIQNGIGEAPRLDTDFIGSSRRDQVIACTVKNHFHQKNGGGEINAKGVARDTSQLEINGIIAIEQPGGGTNTYMHEHALLLSKQATVKATPGLEIDTNDVKASHGASVSNLSDDAIFYAKSRGIDEETARTMLAKGFLSDRLSVIKDLSDLVTRIDALI